MEPNNLESLIQQGQELLGRGDYQLALEIFDQALAIDPQSTSAWYNTGNALYDLKEYQKAIQCYDQAIHLNPEFEYAWCNKGLALYNLKEYEKAIQCYDQAIHINPQSEYAWDSKGNALRNLKEYEKAIECYDQAIQINPQYESAWYNKGIALDNLKEYEKAIKCCDQAIQINPQYLNAWYCKGIALYHLKEYEKAIKCFDQAIHINPQSEQTWQNKGKALNDLKEYEKAIKCFDRAIQINPQDMNAWNNRAICLLSAGRYKEAIKNYDEALKHQNPENPEHQEICGSLYSSKGSILLRYAEIQSMPNERRYYRERAENSYELALEFFLFEPDPEIKFQAFPEQHLEVCQKLIGIYRYTRPNEIPEMIRQVNDLLARFLANPDYPASRKIAIQRKLANYQQLRIDDLIQSDKTIEALELAEQRKNDCLRWLFSIDNQKIISSKYEQIQTLLNPNTAVIYWHISPTAISTFILKHQQTPIVKTVLFQPTNQTDNLQRFEKWLDQWLENYDDYCQQPKNQTKQPDYSNLSIAPAPGGIKLNFAQLKQPDQPISKDKADHPWRQTMDSQIAELRDILKIKDIWQDLDGITNLILIPHRYLHTLPLEILFPEQYTMTRLPSAKVGIDQQAFSPATNPAMLLLEQRGQNLTFTEIEAIALQQLYKIDHHLQGDVNKEQVLENLLNPDINLFHFTGHAQHDSSTPSESALVLNNGEQLTMIDIYQKINQCQQYYQLVCLNGCETGITNREDLTDEFIGLASAFLPKTQYVISSLWRVDDQTSTLLMMEFYRLLQVEKINAIEALNQAKYWLRDLTNSKLADWYDQILVPLFLNEPDQKYLEYCQMQSQRLKESDIMETSHYKHPYHWAGFIIHGSFV